MTVQLGFAEHDAFGGDEIIIWNYGRVAVLKDINGTYTRASDFIRSDLGNDELKFGTSIKLNAQGNILFIGAIRYYR